MSVWKDLVSAYSFVGSVGVQKKKKNSDIGYCGIFLWRGGGESEPQSKRKKLRNKKRRPFISVQYSNRGFQQQWLLQIGPLYLF